jgi:hypothetical protein
MLVYYIYNYIYDTHECVDISSRGVAFNDIFLNAALLYGGEDLRMDPP